MPAADSDQQADRLRVVYLDHCARLSGAELALSRLLPALVDRVDPLVILGESGPLVDRLVEQGIAVQVLPMGSRVRDLRKDTVAPGGFGPRPMLELARYVVRLVRTLRRLRPDLVHTNSLKAALYGGLAGRLAGVPVVWHVRDRIADDYLPGPAVRMVRLLSHVLPHVLVANSSATLSTLPSSVSSAVVFNPVVRDSVAAPLRAPHSRAERLQVGVVGRLAEWKGQHVFLEAFALSLAGSGAQARLVGSALFGEEDYEQRLRRDVERLGLAGQVEFRGFQDDIWSELAQLDVLVHCSVTPEPFGQVVIEGMAAGLPVVASAAGGPLEVVTDGVDGILVTPGDPQALADALTRLAEDPELRQRLGQRARITSLEYSPRATAGALIAVYEAALSSGSRGADRATGRDAAVDR